MITYIIFFFSPIYSSTFSQVVNSKIFTTYILGKSHVFLCMHHLHSLYDAKKEGKVKFCKHIFIENKFQYLKYKAICFVTEPGPILAVHCMQYSHAITCPFSKYFEILYIFVKIFKDFALLWKITCMPLLSRIGPVSCKLLQFPPTNNTSNTKSFIPSSNQLSSFFVAPYDHSFTEI